MGELDGSGRDLRGLFKIPKENKFEGNLHQQMPRTCCGMMDLSKNKVDKQ